MNRGTNYPLVWFLPIEKGISSHNTFTEVFARRDTIRSYAAWESWTQEMARSLKGEIVAIGGKTLRGSFDAAVTRCWA